MSFYSEMRDGVAAPLIAEFKTGSVKLYQPGAILAGGDPLNPYAGSTPTETPRNAIVTGYAAKDLGGLIIAGDRRIIIDAKELSTEPAGDWSVLIDDVPHAIVSIERVPAAGVAVVFKIQARAAGPANG